MSYCVKHVVQVEPSLLMSYCTWCTFYMFMLITGLVTHHSPSIVHCELPLYPRRMTHQGTMRGYCWSLSGVNVSFDNMKNTFRHFLSLKIFQVPTLLCLYKPLFNRSCNQVMIHVFCLMKIRENFKF